VVERLKKQQHLIADEFEDVTFCWIQIANFSEVLSTITNTTGGIDSKNSFNPSIRGAECAKTSDSEDSQVSQQTGRMSVQGASELVLLLNELFGTYDKLTTKTNVHKVESVGECYMAVAGHIPTEKKSNDRNQSFLTPPERVLKFAHAVLRAVERVTYSQGRHLQVKVGVHSGPAAAGLVGLSMPRYCFFGPTVSETKKVAAAGEIGCIAVSSVTRAKLAKSEKKRAKQACFQQSSLEGKHNPLSVLGLLDRHNRPLKWCEQTKAYPNIITHTTQNDAKSGVTASPGSENSSVSRARRLHLLPCSERAIQRINFQREEPGGLVQTVKPAVQPQLNQHIETEEVKVVRAALATAKSDNCQKDAEILRKDAKIRRKDAEIRQKDAKIQQLQNQIANLQSLARTQHQSSPTKFSSHHQHSSRSSHTTRPHHRGTAIGTVNSSREPCKNGQTSSQIHPLDSEIARERRLLMRDAAAAAARLTRVALRSAQANMRRLQRSNSSSARERRSETAAYGSHARERRV
jgi:class 3 adenylate cyclase